MLKESKQSHFCLLDVLVLVGHLLHQGLVVKQFQRVHLLTVLVGLLVSHLRLQHVLVLLVHVLQVLLLRLLVVEEGLGVFLPHGCLLLVDLLLLHLLLVLLVYLPGQVFPHLPLLVLRHPPPPFFLVLLLPQLVVDVSHHLLILSPNLLLLILDHGVREGGHHCLNFLLSFSLLFLTLPLQFVLKASILFLSLDVLRKI
jgi:hypothetical protein